MTTFTSTLDTTAAEYQAARAAMETKLAEIHAAHDIALAGGGEKYLARHRDRGKLLARERIDSILDRGSPFLELCPLAGWGSDFTVGGSCVAGIGVVSGVECILIASDPTVKGGTSNPWTLRKTLRINDIAMANRMPVISLIESGGADLPTQKDVFIPGGALFRDLTRLSKAGIPTITVVYGSSTAGGAYVPGMSDHTILIDGRSTVYLAGPPLVKAATGEIADDETLGGADMHSRVSGLGDYLATDEHDAARIARRVVRRLNWKKQGPAPRADFAEPKYSADELMGIIGEDLKVPVDPREILARVVDDSDFDEFKPLYGPSMLTAWAEIHGYPVGILANVRGVIFSEEAQKATQFIQLANRSHTPLIFMHNTTGYMVGSQYERGGIIKHGSQMINAVSNSTVPHISLITAASYGAGNYGMCGRAYDPRFLFTWPSSKSAVMGSTQLADVITEVASASATRRGTPMSEEDVAGIHAAIEGQIEEQSTPLFLSGLLYDDGVLDPRDTRDVLGMCLSSIHNAPVEGTDSFGVFRM